MNYGTDVAVGWVQSDVAATITVTDSAAGDSHISSDSANAVDGGALEDASVDASIDASIDTATGDSHISSDSANAVDGGVLEDASVDASIDGDS